MGILRLVLTYIFNLISNFFGGADLFVRDTHIEVAVFFFFVLFDWFVI